MGKLWPLSFLPSLLDLTKPSFVWFSVPLTRLMKILDGPGSPSYNIAYPCCKVFTIKVKDRTLGLYVCIACFWAFSLHRYANSNYCSGLFVFSRVLFLPFHCIVVSIVSASRSPGMTQWNTILQICWHITCHVTYQNPTSV